MVVCASKFFATRSEDRLRRSTTPKNGDCTGRASFSISCSTTLRTSSRATPSTSWFMRCLVCSTALSRVMFGSARFSRSTLVTSSCT